MGLLKQIRSVFDSGENTEGGAEYYATGESCEIYPSITFNETMVEVEYNDGDSWVGKFHHIDNSNSGYSFSCYDFNEEFFEELYSSTYYYHTDVRGDIINQKPGNSIKTIVSKYNFKDINFKWTLSYVAVAKYKVYNVRYTDKTGASSDRVFQDYVIMEKPEYEAVDVEEMFD